MRAPQDIDYVGSEAKKTEEDCRFSQLDTLVIAIHLVEATWMALLKGTLEWRCIENFCSAGQDAEEPTHRSTGESVGPFFSYGYESDNDHHKPFDLGVCIRPRCSVYRVPYDSQ